MKNSQARTFPLHLIKEKHASTKHAAGAAHNNPLPGDSNDSHSQWSMRRRLAAQDGPRSAVLDSLHRDLEGWRLLGANSSRFPDMESTLCRIVANRPDRGKGNPTLSNTVLLRSLNGGLSAAVLIDPADSAGPAGHWPARAVAMLLQLSVLQEAINVGTLDPLADFVALLNPHDMPRQASRSTNWAGLLPVLSSSRRRRILKHRDLLMPDYSFSPSAYLTSGLWQSGRNRTDNASRRWEAAVPRGWPDEFRAILRAGRSAAWREKERTLFWRGARTHNMRGKYAHALLSGQVHLPAGIKADIQPPCVGHCSAEQGAVPPSSWCRHQLLLSLPGVSFAVGFKYLLLCGSLIVRGAANGTVPEFEQWFHPGLRAQEHFVDSSSIGDLEAVVSEAVSDSTRADAIATNAREFGESVLNPTFVLLYWHALLSGYATLFDWRQALHSGPWLDATEACRRRSTPQPLHRAEELCFSCGGGSPLDLSGETLFSPLPPPAELRPLAASQPAAWHRHYARVLPRRFSVEGREADRESRAALGRYLRRTGGGEARLATPAG